MSLRRRLTVASTLAVALAVTVACVVAYLVVRGELLGQVDRSLRAQATAVSAFGNTVRFDRRVRIPLRTTVPQPSPAAGGPLPYLQILRRDGTPRLDAQVPGSFAIAIDDVDRAIAAGSRPTTLRTIEEDGERLRLITVPIRPGAVQLARPLDGIDDTLGRMRLILAGLVVGGVLVALLLGRLVTRRVTAPLREVVAATTHIAATDDLGTRLDVRSRDEVGELAQRFNVMLDRLSASRDALASSVAAQRGLVADASHELRTPITSLRTNIEVLLEAEPGELDAATRTRLLSDVRSQIEELGETVTDVIDLARGDVDAVGDAVEEDVRLDAVARAAVDRARRDHPQATFTLDARPATIAGDPVRLARAVGNLLDNAAKHGGRTVRVAVDADGIRVADDGPGFAPADLPTVFERFARGSTAQARPGSGLGLAIVRQVAHAHGGTATAANAAGGGAVVTLALPARPVDDAR